MTHRAISYEQFLQAKMVQAPSRGFEISADEVNPLLKPQTREEWQESLGFVGEVPTVADIDKAYRERAMKVHPDGPTPDRVVFDKLTEHRDRARAWARGQQAVEHEKVMAIDIFNEVRLNLNAVRMVIAALRQIERCGAPMMMERAFRGFHKQINATASPDSVGLEASRV